MKSIISLIDQLLHPIIIHNTLDSARNRDRTRSSFAQASPPQPLSTNTSIPAETSSITKQDPEPKRRATAKRLFKNLARRYLQQRHPPPKEDVEQLWQFSDIIQLRDVVQWKDEAGVKRGILFHEGKIEFDKYPIPPHDDLIDVFNRMFLSQMVFPYINTPASPDVFLGLGTTGNEILLSLIMLDMNLPGRKKQPDAAYTPEPRPNPNNLLNHLIQIQPLFGIPWPTIVLEVGNSESVPKLVKHRDRCLGGKLRSTYILEYPTIETIQERQIHGGYVWHIVIYGPHNLHQTPRPSSLHALSSISSIKTPSKSGQK